MSTIVIRNTSWLLLEKMIRMSLGLFVGIYVAKYLGPDEFGKLSYAISIYTILFAFSNFGIDGVVVKQLVARKDKCEIGTWIYTSMVIKFALSSFSIFISIIYAIIHSFDEQSSLLLILSFSLSFLFLNVFDLYFQSEQKNKYVAFSNIAMLLITNLLKVIFVMNNKSLEYFAGVYILESIIFGLIISFFFKNKGKKINYCFSFDVMKDVLSKSWPLFFSSLSFVLYNSANTIMLNHELSSFDVGIYNAASRFVNIWHFLPGILITSLFPLMINKRENCINNAEFELFMSKVFSIFIWVPLIIAIFVFFTSDYIIDLTYGSEFKRASSVLSILIFSNVTIFITSVWNKWMLIEDNTKITFVYQLFKIILLVTFNLILIPAYGLGAVLISTILSGLIVQFIIPLFMRTQRNYINVLMNGLFFRWI